MIASILPPNATSLELHVEQSATATLETMPLDIAKLWNPDTCPAHILPWLAWALDVEQWRSDAPLATQRAAIKGSIAVHDTMGTPAAMKQALGNLGYGRVVVDELPNIVRGRGLKYNGMTAHVGMSLAYQFDIFINSGQTPSFHQKANIKTMINVFKNARSHVRNLYYASHFYQGKQTHNSAIVRDGGLIL